VKVVLVTGAGSGVGKAVAEALLAGGWRVYGTTRKGVPVSNGIIILPLEVTDPLSISACIQEILRREGKLDALVNNAGMGIAGPLEETPEDMAAEQMNVNLFGAWRAAKEALPAFRQQGKGRIINISSLAGVIPIPYQGFYSASKAALEILFHAMEMETSPWGVKITNLALGDTRTEFTSHRRCTPGMADGPYGLSAVKSIAKMEADEQNGMDPRKVGKQVLKLLESRNPPHKAGCGIAAKLILLLQRLLPGRLVYYIVKKMYT
jgi:NAD(P)-dependent dehydrogenase (short-subunit alcohol dehydrogenase family)